MKYILFFSKVCPWKERAKLDILQQIVVVKNQNVTDIATQTTNLTN